MAQKMVVMEHPKLEKAEGYNPRSIPKASFERVWSGRGWKLVPEKKEK